jgi:hypothetical protein
MTARPEASASLSFTMDKLTFTTLLLLEDNKQKQQRLCVGASVRLCMGGETMKGPAVQPPIPPPPPLPLPPVAIFIYRSSKPCRAFDH